MEPISLRTPLALLLSSLGMIAALWWWLATPITLVRAPIDPSAKLQCVSYAPFRDAQTPLVPTTQIPPEQIAQDLAQLAKITDCVRTYSIENGLDQVPALAAKVGLKVIQGIWLSSNRIKNLAQIAIAIELTKEHPGVITALVVGNEVLLRGEMTTADLAVLIRSVKSRVTVPVTYADVWEFWLRNREVYDAVDFVTIHILPYWEDIPVRAKHAAGHVDDIRRRMAVAFPGKEILIGETGWPSAGRMREGALPSRTNQARVVSEILDLAKREKFRVNLIEAYDQPWKRQLEGTVGGYWGMIDDAQRAVKYPPGEPISNYPSWKLLMGCGMALSAFVFLAGWLTLRRRPWKPRLSAWIAVGTSATTAGMLLGAAADIPRTARTARRPDQISAGCAPGSRGCRHHGDRGANRARLYVRSALPRFSVRFADDGGGAVRGVDAAQPAERGCPPDRRIRFCRLAGRGRAVHRLQRGQPELAVDVDLRDLSLAGAHAVAGAGRANPKMSRPIAIPDSTIL